MNGSWKISLGMIVALIAGRAAAEAPPSKSHAGTLSGTVAAIDAAQRSLLVRDAKGRRVQVFWTGATRVTGAALGLGETVTVRWMPREGKRVATVVQVHAAPAVTAAAATSPTSVSPTPKAP